MSFVIRKNLLPDHQFGFQKSHSTIGQVHRITDVIEKAFEEKQVRTNIGLADTLIPSSFIYLIYMGSTGPCDSIKIIFGYHVNS